MSWIANPVIAVAIGLMERGWLPESLIRSGIRKLCRRRLAGLHRQWSGNEDRELAAFLRATRDSAVAVETGAANEQHYEVPARFFDLVLGPHKKYSSCYFPEGERSLAKAEVAALEVTCQRADLADGQKILELGCGWGSLTLWMAEHFPTAQITAVSNSASQREYILEQARQRGIDGNLTVLTQDISHFSPAARFDRVVSVEMFEHVRNHGLLFQRIASWLEPGGSLFVHIFCHRQWPYLFETAGAANWMGRHFFTGGMMPSEKLFDCYSEDLQIVDRWQWNGRHYADTANAWARNLDARQVEIISLFEAIYGAGQGKRWLMRWKVFFLACAELFGFNDGNEWFVAHYLLSPTEKRA